MEIRVYLNSVELKYLLAFLLFVAARIASFLLVMKSEKSYNFKSIVYFVGSWVKNTKSMCPPSLNQSIFAKQSILYPDTDKVCKIPLTLAFLELRNCQ